MQVRMRPRQVSEQNSQVKNTFWQEEELFIKKVSKKTPRSRIRAYFRAEYRYLGNRDT
jgi:hypothetical protein